MNQFELYLKRGASFLRSILPKPPKNSIGDILNSDVGSDITDRFVDLYYSGNHPILEWRGYELLKNPCDLWVYIELIKEIRPKYIIETGTHHGASALYYSDMAKMLGIQTTVITIDINPKIDYDLKTTNIISLKGISTSKEIIVQIEKIVNHNDTIIVILDSDHSKKNVLNELNLYSKFVSKDSYLIVEDTIINGHPTFPSHGPGPYEAIEDFFKINDSFSVDLECQKFLLTFNNRGYLKKNK